MENIDPELIEKAKQAKSAEELAFLAKQNGMEMTADEAKAYYAQLHPTSGEMADDELENVAGGGCHSGDGRLVVTPGYDCNNWVCVCGNGRAVPKVINYAQFILCSSCGNEKSCKYCKYMSRERGLFLCNHPANRN